MKNLVLLLIPLLSFLNTNAQTPSTSSSGEFLYLNNVQFEAGGHGLYYSFNYERILVNLPKFKLTSQVGASYYPPSTGMRQLWIPISFNQLYSWNKHHIETGIGPMVTFDHITQSEVIQSEFYSNYDFMLILRLGYRYQPPTAKWFLRAGFTPIIEETFHPSGAASVGYNF